MAIHQDRSSDQGTADQLDSDGASRWIHPRCAPCGRAVIPPGYATRSSPRILSLPGGKWGTGFLRHSPAREPGRAFFTGDGTGHWLMSENAIHVHAAASTAGTPSLTLAAGPGALRTTLLMARITFLEAARRKILWIATLAGFLFLAFFWTALHFVLKNATRQANTVSL